MTKKMILITTEELENIFSIIGFEQYIVSDIYSAEELIKEKIGDESIGLIIIEEELFKKLTEKTRFILEKRWKGAICKLPSIKELTIEEGYTMKEITRVLGYQLKIT